MCVVCVFVRACERVCPAVSVCGVCGHVHMYVCMSVLCDVGAQRVCVCVSVSAGMGVSVRMSACV